jgi:hypothetical protein
MIRADRGGQQMRTATGGSFSSQIAQTIHPSAGLFLDSVQSLSMTFSSGDGLTAISEDWSCLGTVVAHQLSRQTRGNSKQNLGSAFCLPISCDLFSSVFDS